MTYVNGSLFPMLPWNVLIRINHYLLDVAMVKEEVKEEIPEESVSVPLRKAKVGRPSARDSKTKQVHRFRGRFGGQRRDTRTQILALQAPGSFANMIPKKNFKKLVTAMLDHVAVEPEDHARVVRRVKRKTPGVNPSGSKFRIAPGALHVLQHACEDFVTDRLVKGQMVASFMKTTTLDKKHLDLVQDLEMKPSLTSPFLSRVRMATRERCRGAKV